MKILGGSMVCAAAAAASRIKSPSTALPFSNVSTSVSRCGRLHAPITPTMRIAHPAVPIPVIKKGDAGEREITLPLGEFLKGPAPIRRPERQVQLGKDFVRSAHVDNGPVKNSPARMVRAPCNPDEGNLGIAGHGNPGQFGGRVGMGKAAADGAAVADLIMRDVGDCLAQQRVRGGQPSIVLDVAPANPGAKPNAAVADGNVAEPGNPAQIDQHARRRQPEGENRHQALPGRRQG
jgi:hypothetical protein